jgi:hypothetical protein
MSLVIFIYRDDLLIKLEILEKNFECISSLSTRATCPLISYSLISLSLYSTSYQALHFIFSWIPMFLPLIEVKVIFSEHCSSSDVMDRVLHSYKISDTVIVLQILVQFLHFYIRNLKKLNWILTKDICPPPPHSQMYLWRESMSLRVCLKYTPTLVTRQSKEEVVAGQRLRTACQGALPDETNFTSMTAYLRKWKEWEDYFFNDLIFQLK